MTTKPSMRARLTSSWISVFEPQMNPPLAPNALLSVPI